MTKYKCLLIHPIIKPKDPPYNIPLGLIQIAAVVEQKGHDVALFDNNAYRIPHEQVIEEIKDETWNLIGIGNLVTTYSWQKKMFGLLRKEFPNATLVAGGGLPTSIKGELLKLIPEVDIAVIGEGERTTSQILDNLDTKSWIDVEGIYSRNGYSIPRLLTQDEMDQLPYPKYDLLPLDIYFKHSKIPLSPESMSCNRRLSIEASRGCTFGCSFCIDLYSGNPRTANRTQIRYFHPKWVIGLMKELRLKYSVDFISFMDENFTINRKHVMRFCDELEKELGDLDPPLLWGTTAHVNTIDDEMLHRMREVGCSYLDLGLESMNDRILKNDIGKGSSVEDNVRGFNQCINSEIYPITNFITGFPNDNCQSAYDITKFIKENNIECGPFFASPYPSTGLFNRCKDKIMKQFGTLENFLIRCKDDVASDFIINLTNYNDAEILGLRQMIMNHDLNAIKAFAKQKGEDVI